MKKSRLILRLLSCVIAPALLISCKRDPDPCAGLKPVSADFKFYQKFIGSEVDSIFYIDTVILVPYKNIYNPARIGFIATEENATYRWELEDYPKNNTTKSFFLDFDQPFGSIEVKLTVTKEPNTSCFPNDDGADTVTKTLVVLDGSKFKFAFEGTFTGYLTDSPSDVFDIRIVNFGERPQRTYTGHYGLRVYNLPKGCGRNNFSPAEYTHEITYGTFRSFYIEGKGYANVPCGKDPFIAVGRVYDHNNKISIHIAAYRYDYSTNKNIRTDSQFIGIRKK